MSGTVQRMSIESKTLLKLLDDGEWHQMAEIMGKFCPAIAPGKALRRYETNERNRALHHGPRKVAELDDEDKIRSGQRAIAVDTVTSLKRRYIEVVDTEKDGRLIRRRAEIVPFNEHGHRPDETPPPSPAPPADAPSVAFFSEAQVREIVAQEVADALDAFQSGMQLWLNERFAILEVTAACRANPAHWPTALERRW